MAKKTKAAEVAANQAAFNKATKVTAPTPTTRTSYGLTIRSLKPIPDGVKMATQAKLVAKVIADAGAKGLTETELASKLVPAGLVTRQLPLRIYRFYRKLLVEGGYIATA